MGTNFTLPPDTRAINDPNPPEDMNNVVDALNAMGAVQNVLNATYSGGADPTGINDSQPAFQAAINALPTGGGSIWVAPGTYKFNSSLTPKSGLRLTGPGYQAATLTAAGSALFNMDPGSQLDVIEIDHLTLQAAASQPIFTGMYLTRSSVHDCYLNAASGSPGSSIWHSNSGTGYMAECRFFRNREQIYGTSRTVPAWLLQSTNNVTLFQVNDNHWYDNVCFNNDHDTAQYHYELSFAASSFSTSTNNANTFEGIVFEFPTGGMILLDSCSYTTVNRCTNEDLAALTVGNPLIAVTKNANGGGPISNKIRSYSRRAGSATIIDIQLASNCNGTVIDSPYQAGGGTALTIDFGSSSNVTAIAVPSGAVLSNAAGTGAVTASSVATAPASPASTTSTSQVMMGLGSTASWAFTPLNTGIVTVSVMGGFLTQTAITSCTIGGRFGTGTAPVNGAAVTGTSFGGNTVYQATSISHPSQFSILGRFSLTPGTAYWFDLAVATGNASDAATVSNVAVLIEELPA